MGVWIVSSFVALSFGAYYFYIRVKKRKLMELLDARLQLEHQEFGPAYFAHSPLRAQLASDVRVILSRHVPVPLDGLSPQDKFQEQLMMDTFDSMSSAQFIAELEGRYGISFRDEKALDRDLTFSQLIDLIEDRLTDLHPGRK